MSWPGYCSSLASSRSNSVKASAVAPANPPITSPLVSRRTFLALALTTVWPMETCPSPPIATVPPLRTVRMVVPCQVALGPEGLNDVCIGGPAWWALIEVSRCGNAKGALPFGPAGTESCCSGALREPLIQGPRVFTGHRLPHAQRLDQAHHQGNRRRGRG